MVQNTDDKFYDRADAHIHLSNEHCEDIGAGKVSASMMYATARFNTWVSACGFENAGQMKEDRQQTIEYFVSEYKKMLEENLDDYIENFDKYMQRG